MCIRDDQQAHTHDQQCEHERQAVQSQAKVQADFRHPWYEFVQRFAAHHGWRTDQQQSEAGCGDCGS